MPKAPLVTAFALSIGLCTAHADVAANKALVTFALDAVLAQRDASAVDRTFSADYIQHNPMLPSGSAPIKRFLSKPVNPDAPARPANVVHRILGEGDLVATHATYYNFGPTPLVAFDVYRIENGLIAEHWDNLTPLASTPNPSGRTQVDGAVVITDHDRTQVNKAHVVEMVQRLFIDREALKPTQFISPDTYLQHNPLAGDGLAGLRQLMDSLRAQGKTLAYDTLELVVAEGNFVLTAVAGRLGEQPTAFYDLWRLEDGLIVEHWDVIAPISTDSLPPNYPGKF
ncbi:MAG: nuclear transport factor 2 family protein [Pseudomonadota bacterium]